MFLSRRRDHRKFGAALWIAVVIWAVCAAASFAYLTSYSQGPGLANSPLPIAESSSNETATGWKLFMAVHPQCPCTLASVGELQRLMAGREQDIDCTVLVYRPQERSAEWSETKLVQRARTTPGVTVGDDVDGRRAMELGIATSGGVVLYDSLGEPRYYGGITSARGHEGHNAGAASIVRVVTNRTEEAEPCPVYGCPLFEQGILNAND